MKSGNHPKVFEFDLCHWEGRWSHLFFHPTVKSKSKFKKDINLMFKKYAPKYLKMKKGKDLLGLDDLAEYVMPKMSELGYVKIKTIRFGVSYSMPFIQDSSHYVEKCSISLLGKELHQEFVDNNNSVHEAWSKPDVP
jgi:hypothetical protein